jgi:hypothetical protein
MNRILELYGFSTQAENVNWSEVIEKQYCPFLKRRCIKIRKSQPVNTIGTCTVLHGSQESRPIVICPHRFLGRYQVFTDCIHLLTLHEPGNELHIVPEISIPGGSVDYFLVSAQDAKVKDFAGIEFQTLDTTGTVWPERQRFLLAQGVGVDESDIQTKKGYGMNWKMTAKTTLVQLHHKVQTFEGLGKHLVLVVQNHFMDYMHSQFQFDHLQNARLGDSLHIHTYQLLQADPANYRFQLENRYSTNSDGVAKALGLQADPNLELGEIIRPLESKISNNTLFVLFG